MPAYDSSTLKAGIVHFGVGNFHRAHQAVYLDDLFNLGIDHDWGIVGAGVRAADEDLVPALRVDGCGERGCPADSRHADASLRKQESSCGEQRG